MYEVRDGIQTVKFEGELLATSSSRTKKQQRWVEFRLYKTTGGSYVLSRVGMSLYYHHSACPIVKRNGIIAVPAENISLNMLPCEDCRPNKNADAELFPETPRYWAQKFVADAGAEGVVASLKREDEFGAEYLTNVAKKLLISAAKKDQELHNAFYSEWID